MEPNGPRCTGGKGSVTKIEEEVTGEVDFPTRVSFTDVVRCGSRAFAYIICL